MKSKEQRKVYLHTADDLEQIPMRPDELFDAKASLHQAEIFADVLMRAYSAVRNVIGSSGHAIGTIPHHG